MCMEHLLGWMPAFGLSAGQAAGLVVANVFGWHEAGSELTFTQKNVDDLLQQWREILPPDLLGEVSFALEGADGAA